MLEQGGTAKKLRGRVLVAFLTALADGHGGISEIKKTSTEGLVDTYTITFADLTLWDFTVKNGAKGDKGDKSYVWIKYASQEPTEESHSFGDVPDEWIGIYSGDLEVPPEDWTLYKWFRFKGERGKTGLSEKVSYTTIQYKAATEANEDLRDTEDGWTNDIPDVAQGGFLWTKVQIVFLYGDPVTLYSRARYGKDGIGSVSSVNGQSPDANGNVYLTPSMIGALDADSAVLKGLMDAGGHRITNLSSPSADSDPATYGLVRGLETVIWKNASTLSGFAEQNLAVGCVGTPADKVVIIFKNGPSGKNYVVTPEIPLDDIDAAYEAYSPVNDVWRTFSCYRTSTQFIQFEFGNGYKAGVVADDYMIPVKIINVRKVV